MSTPSTPGPDVRIGNADLDPAIKALDEHLSAGRLDPDEYADRVTKVSVARLALFFVLPVHSWLAFLLIPAAGVIVHGDAHSRKPR